MASVSDIQPLDEDNASEGVYPTAINDMSKAEEDPLNEGLVPPSAETDTNAEFMKRDWLTNAHVAAYSVGHFSNDLCAAMWFFYLSWYLTRVVQLDETTTGYCMLSGQIADGVMTPIVGFMSDKFNSPCGKRTPWYLIGTVLVIPCFLGIFSYPEFINDPEKLAPIS